MDDQTSTSRAQELHQAAEEPRVRFGPKLTDSMPLTWAEEVLTWLYAERKNVFGDAMLARLGIERGRPGRKPAGE